MVAMSLGTTEWILAPVVVALVACISVLAWAETAIGRTSRARAAAMVDQLGPRAERVLRLASAPERYVNVMLLLLLMLVQLRWLLLLQLLHIDERRRWALLLNLTMGRRRRRRRQTAHVATGRRRRRRHRKWRFIAL